MLVTEEEARTRWCPFAREGYASTGGYNRWGGAFGDGLHCFASQCMAWRAETRRMPDPEKSSSGWRKEPTGRGYCGLAGLPYD